MTTKHRTSLAAVGAIEALAIGGSGAIDISVQAQAGGDPRAYFDALVRRADHRKSFSLRAHSQLPGTQGGGPSKSNDAPPLVTYGPARDLDPSAMPVR